MSFLHLFLACLSLPTALSQGVLSGCPSYGCTPSGSFSLLTSSGIPRSGVKVIWSVKISNSTGTGSPLLGCVSNSNHLVCPTPHGYVGVDADNGKILWNRTILDNPSLPIMDVYGDVIGSDGKHLVKVDGDGTVEQPIIPLDPQMVPIYSVEYADENILLLVSETGELVAYLTNGIPLANLFLRGNVQNYNGTFHPIAQPVMNGSRAYVLTQFRPEPSYTDIPREKLGTLGLQRLYAVDVHHAMVLIIDIAWYLNLETEVKSHVREAESGQGRIITYSGEMINGLSEWEQLNSQNLPVQSQEKAELLHESQGADSKLSSERSRLLKLLKEMSITDRARKTRHDQVFVKSLNGVSSQSDKNIVHMEQDTLHHSDLAPRTSRKGHKIPTQVPQRSSLLYYYGVVLAIVAPPADNCIHADSRTKSHRCGQAVNATLWGVNDNGANYTVCYVNEVSLARMSVYDPGYNPSSDQFRDSKCLPGNERFNYHRNKRSGSENVGEGGLVWTVTEYGDVINGFDQISSQVQQRVNVSHMLNTSVQVTSRVMVSKDAHHPADLLVFGVRRTDGNHTDVINDVMSNATNHLIAVNTSLGEFFESIMWTVPVPYDYEVQGQIATMEDMNSNNSSFVVMANGTSGQIVFAFK